MPPALRPLPWLLAGLLAVATALAAWHRPAREAPAALTPQQWLQGTGAAGWRTARLAGHEAVLVVEFDSLTAQGRALNRAGALIEQALAPRDRVLRDDELQRLIDEADASTETLFLGHDYPLADLARFYNLARAQAVPLNAEESRLRDLLVAQGLLHEGRLGWAARPLPQALVTFARATDPAGMGYDAALRAAVIEHELSHGRFFTSAAAQAQAWRFWREQLSDDERARWRVLLEALGYDPANERLMANEAQAFLMHTPDERVFGAATLELDEAGLAAMRARFARAAPGID